MSIIFQKLKTLKRDSIDPEEFKRKGFQNQPRVYTFKTLIFSPKGVLIIVTALFAFGMISFLSLSFLKEYLDSASSNAIVVRHQRKDILPENTQPAENGNASSPLTTAPDRSGPVPDGESVPGMGPDPNAAPDPGTSPVSDPAESSGFKAPEYFTRLFRKNTTAPSSKPSDSPGKNPEDVLFYIPKSIMESPVAETTPVFSEKAALPGSQIMSVPSAKSGKPSSATESGPSEARIKDQEEALRTAKEKRTQKTSAITLLAEDLEAAIEKKDIVRIHDLFDALAKENGRDSLYYLKLKAFQDIREENYESAKKFLNRVLNKDMNDFDANFNLSVIEIREQKPDDARQRLTRLKEIHPSRSQIDDLLNSL